MAMNPERKAEWLTALRSGEYEQGAGYLNRNSKFCCLGVATDLAVKAGLGAWQMGINTEFGVHDFIPADGTHERGECGLLPREVARWLGIESTNPAVEVGDFRALRRLTVLNDEHKLSFDEIAELIEEQL